MNHSRVMLVTLLSTVAIDQVTKIWARAAFDACTAPPVALCDRVAVFGDLGILRTENPDGALGILTSGWAVLAFLVAATTIALVTRRRPSSATTFCVALMAGGVVANLVDRAFFGAVTDFIDVPIGTGDAGIVLNLADIWLVVGGIGWAIVTARGRSSAVQDRASVSPA